MMPEKSRCEHVQQADEDLQVVDAKLSNLEMLETLFNMSLDMLCVADFDGHFRLVNSAFENTLGYSKEELLKTPFMELVHPDDQAQTRVAMNQLSAGQSVKYFENRYRCRNGSYKWLSWTSVPVVGQRFEYAVARDVTEQKTTQRELAAQRDLFEHVLSNVPAAIFWKDRNSVFLGANNRFAEDAGFRSSKDLIGKTDYEMAWTKEQSEFYRACDREIMDSGQPMLDIGESQQQADGTTAELLTNKVPLKDSSGQVVGILGIYMDISKLKEAEEKIRQYQLEIEHLSRLSVVGEMASVLAHEINQPLTALISYCGTAGSLLNAMASPPQQLGELLERAIEQAHRASDIVRNLRETFQRGESEKQCLDIDDVIHTVSNFIRYKEKESGIRIDFYPDCQSCGVIANRIEIGQVLTNLLRNSVEAIKRAKKQNGQVVVRTRLGKSDFVEVTVTDNGPGIPVDLAKTIFEPFQTTKKSGTGIGLSISRNIIEAHGGRLWADADYKAGASLGFLLPTCPL
jgi:PAS domain S-box-containing protein